jgi:hypothetical protein
VSRTLLNQFSGSTELVNVVQGVVELAGAIKDSP